MKCDNELCENEMGNNPHLFVNVGDSKVGAYWGGYCSYDCAIAEIAGTWQHLKDGGTLETFKPQTANNAAGAVQNTSDDTAAEDVPVMNFVVEDDIFSSDDDYDGPTEEEETPENPDVPEQLVNAVNGINGANMVSDNPGVVPDPNAADHEALPAEENGPDAAQQSLDVLQNYVADLLQILSQNIPSTGTVQDMKYAAPDGKEYLTTCSLVEFTLEDAKVAVSFRPSLVGPDVIGIELDFSNPDWNLMINPTAIDSDEAASYVFAHLKAVGIEVSGVKA